MSGIWKSNIGLSIFGESHGVGIGITLTNIIPGLKLDYDYIQSQLDRRKPGQNDLVTPRKEGDKFKIVSGVFNGITTGAPLTMFIENTDTRSKDYSNIKNRIRPGHGDYTSKVKYNNFNDYRGGGHTSGRLTAGLVFAGAIAKLILKEKNILIGAQITQIGKIKDELIEVIDGKIIDELLSKEFPVINPLKEELMINEIKKCKEVGDSVGGQIRCFGINVPTGLGEPFFDSFESTLAHLIFSVPAVKGLEFGTGFKLSEMNGSEANDEYYLEKKDIKTYTNHNGGILGGITNGAVIDFTVVIKPTPSISILQCTVDYKKLEEVSLVVEGRHDPCIVQRVLPVIEAVLALTLLDKLNLI